MVLKKTVLNIISNQCSSADLFSSVRKPLVFDSLNFCLCFCTWSFAKEWARTSTYCKTISSRKFWRVSLSTDTSHIDSTFFIDVWTWSTLITVLTIFSKSIFWVKFLVSSLKFFSVLINILITSSLTYHKPPLSRHLTNLYRSSLSTD